MVKKVKVGGGQRPPPTFTFFSQEAMLKRVHKFGLSFFQETDMHQAKTATPFGRGAMIISVAIIGWALVVQHDGVFVLTAGGYMIASASIAHVTLLSVTVYLHRTMAHSALELHPALAHFFRFWLWLTTGMITLVWMAIHRWHHATSDTEDDPHSPQFSLQRFLDRYSDAKPLAWLPLSGLVFLWLIWWLFYDGLACYVRASRNKEKIVRHGVGAPDDWIERNLYTPYARFCFIPGAALLFLLFGTTAGFWMLIAQAFVVPVLAAGFINGVTHMFGYQTFAELDTGKDENKAYLQLTGLQRCIGTATNLPWGVVIQGEELHNNHHAFPTSAKFSLRWWEFDLGWVYIALCSFLGLIRIKRIALRERVQDLELDEQQVVQGWFGEGEVPKVIDRVFTFPKPVSIWQLMAMRQYWRNAIAA